MGCMVRDVLIVSNNVLSWTTKTWNKNISNLIVLSVYAFQISWQLYP